LATNPIILHDIAKAYTADGVKVFLCHWRWEILEHPPYSPDMSPCDYDLFAKIKTQCKRHHNTREEIIRAVGQSQLDIKKLTG
jgi:transposase